MKKVFTILGFVAALTSAKSQSTLIHYWNFDGVSNGGVIDTTQPTIKKPNITIGGGALDYAGAYTDLLSPGDSVTNVRTVPAPTGLNECLRARSPYGPLTLTLPTAGYKNIVVKYVTQKSKSGSSYNTVTYTTNGTTWDSAGLIITNGSHAPTTGLGTYAVETTAFPFELVTLDFSNIPAVNNNPNFQIQLNFDNTVAGNNRYDNISVEGLSANLPLILKSFSAGGLNNSSNLWWTTVNESGIESFEIQKSTDNIHFNKVATLNAKNNRGATDYSYNDIDNGSKVFYRLKIINTNGSFAYSPTVVVNKSLKNQSLSVYPNPALNNVAISHNIAQSNGLIKIYDLHGKALISVSTAKGSTQSNLDISAFPKGNYLVSFENNGEVSTTKFIK